MLKLIIFQWKDVAIQSFKQLWVLTQSCHDILFVSLWIALEDYNFVELKNKYLLEKIKTEKWTKLCQMKLFKIMLLGINFDFLENFKLNFYDLKTSKGY